MDLDQLRYFTSVVQVKNFTAAARFHHISQPAISRRIADLEAEVGCKLLTRDSHSVNMTPAGIEFLAYAQDVLKNSESILQRMDSIAKGRTGYLTVMAVPTSAHIIRLVMTEFYKRYPNIQVDLSYGQGKDQISSIRQGKHDFYFSFQSLLEGRDNLEFMTTDHDRYELYVPSAYAHRVDNTDLRSLNFLPLILESQVDAPFLVDKVLALCESRRFDTANVVWTGSFQAVIDLTNAGIGFTVFPHAASRSACTDHLVSFSLPGEDAVQANAMAWNPASMNDSTLPFLEV